MSKSVYASGVALLASLASAQQIVVPDQQAFRSTGSSTAFFRPVPHRLQAAYDSSLFTAAGVNGPITIRRLRFRQLDGRRNPGGFTFTGATVAVGTCAVDYAAMTTDFGANRGTMGPLGAIPALTVDTAIGSVPNTYNVDIDLQAAGATFTYHPATGADLLIDLSMPSAPMPPSEPNGGGTASGTPTPTNTPAAGHTATPSWSNGCSWRASPAAAAPPCTAASA
jgi:hypothetical protein